MTACLRCHETQLGPVRKLGCASTLAHIQGHAWARREQALAVLSAIHCAGMAPRTLSWNPGPHPGACMGAQGAGVGCVVGHAWRGRGAQHPEL